MIIFYCTHVNILAFLSLTFSFVHLKKLGTSPQNGCSITNEEFYPELTVKKYPKLNPKYTFRVLLIVFLCPHYVDILYFINNRTK